MSEQLEEAGSVWTPTRTSLTLADDDLLVSTVIPTTTTWLTIRSTTPTPWVYGYPPALPMMAASAMINDTLYVFGGYYDSNVTADLYSWSSSTFTTTSAASATTATCLDQVITFNFRGNYWTIRGDMSMPVGLCGHSATAVDLNNILDLVVMTFDLTSTSVTQLQQLALQNSTFQSLSFTPVTRCQAGSVILPVELGSSDMVMLIYGGVEAISTQTSLSLTRVEVDNLFLGINATNFTVSDIEFQPYSNIRANASNSTWETQVATTNTSTATAYPASASNTVIPSNDTLAELEYGPGSNYSVQPVLFGFVSSTPSSTAYYFGGSFGGESQSGLWKLDASTKDYWNWTDVTPWGAHDFDASSPLMQWFGSPNGTVLILLPYVNSSNTGGLLKYFPGNKTYSFVESEPTLYTSVYSSNWKGKRASAADSNFTGTMTSASSRPDDWEAHNREGPDMVPAAVPLDNLGLSAASVAIDENTFQAPTRTVTRRLERPSSILGQPVGPDLPTYAEALSVVPARTGGEEGADRPSERAIVITAHVPAGKDEIELRVGDHIGLMPDP
ncbi:hypothetical protein HK405_008413, partial [Cladochytrium tenue]